MRVGILFAVFIIFSMRCPEAFGNNLGFGVHTGYGILKFEERESFSESNFASESEHWAVLFGVSGEYSFLRNDNFYAGITTDWVVGLEDRETWKENDTKVQTDDMKVFGQFYDLRLGYKGNFDNFYYRLYASGGWDDLRFKRSNFVWQGTPISKSISEDISLWRTGIGAGLGYKKNGWALDGRAAYSYYPEGETQDSSLPQYIFDTRGTCLDLGFGIVRQITRNIRVYTGGSYTIQKLKGDNESQNIFWKSKLEILVGVINLTYAF